MESTKITENLRQVKLKNQEIELFKQSFVIVQIFPLQEIHVL